MSDRKKMVRAISAALGEYSAWKLRLQMALAGSSSDITATLSRCDGTCEFGQWLHSPAIDAETKAGKPYKVVSRLHREFHDCASLILTEALAGQKERARALLAAEFTERSEKLVRALAKWRGELIMRS